MSDQGGDPARDRAGTVIGGETAHAPGIHPGDDMGSITGASATNADDVAAELIHRGDPAGTEPVAPLTRSGAWPGDARLRGPGGEGGTAPGTPTPP